MTWIEKLKNVDIRTSVDWNGPDQNIANAKCEVPQPVFLAMVAVIEAATVLNDETILPFANPPDGPHIKRYEVDKELSLALDKALTTLTAKVEEQT